MANLTQRQLQREVEHIFRAVNESRPGLGMILLMFQSRDARSTPPLAMCVHGASTERAIRMLREQADLLERMMKEEKTIEVQTAPTLIKPGDVGSN